VRIRSVEFARGVDANFQLVGGPVTEFRADERTVHARVMIEGRPRSGVITMRWMWRDLQIAQADVDLAEANGGLLFSFGQDTAIRGHLETPQLYIGAGHRLVLLLGQRELGSYPFRVVPPTGARPSRFVSAELFAADPAAGDPGAPTRTFRPDQTVYVASVIALGHASWFDATVKVNGQPDPSLTREAIGPPNGGDEGRSVFPIRPAQGWPAGTHELTLLLDDQQVATIPFTVAAPAAP
jgi:hypothetical protein